MNIFPEQMFKGYEITLENVASKLLLFSEQLHLTHWQTMSYAEHKATNELYDYLHEFRDDLMEKLMGYIGKKPLTYKLESLSNISSTSLAEQMSMFVTSLKQYGEMNNYHDICNLSDELSGRIAKFKYLLTLT